MKSVLKNSAISHGPRDLIYVNILRSILKELKMNYKMKTIDESYFKKAKKTKNGSTIEATKIEPLIDKVADEEEDDGLKPLPYVKSFFNICVKEVDEAIKAVRGKELELEDIKEQLMSALAENTVLKKLGEKEGV